MEEKSKNMSPILLIQSSFIAILSIAMLIPLFVDLATNHSNWKVFAISVLINFIIAILLYISNRKALKILTIRQTFITTVSAWTVIPILGAIPLMYSAHPLSFTDAVFESISAITTTGATVIQDIEQLSKGIQLWRVMLQWLGGIGIIVLAVAVLPMLKIGGMQLFRTESSDKSEKIFARATSFGKVIGGVYLLFTAICTILLYSYGMSWFDAICHTMATISTGGFSNYNSSIAYFNSDSIEIILTIFMFLSGVPLVLYYQFATGKFGDLLKDSQVRTYAGLVFVMITISTIWLSYNNFDFGDALRYAAFNVISIMTSTGFASYDYNQWSGLLSLFFFGTFICACTGSTSGGIKIFRLQVLLKAAKARLDKIISPHRVVVTSYNGKSLPEETVNSVIGFIILFIACFGIISIILSLTGLDYITSISASASAMANLGPGLGDVIGPVGNYSSVSAIAKWVLCFGMIAGRLEIFTILVLFSPFFWRK